MSESLMSTVNNHTLQPARDDLIAETPATMITQSFDTGSAHILFALIHIVGVCIS